MDWLDLLVVQGTFKSLLQHHSSKPANLGVLSFLYSPTLTSVHDYWKNHSFDYYWRVIGDNSSDHSGKNLQNEEKPVPGIESQEATLFR